MEVRQKLMVFDRVFGRLWVTSAIKTVLDSAKTALKFKYEI